MVKVPAPLDGKTTRQQKRINQKSMKKSLIYIIGVAMLSACSEDLQPVMPDNYYDAVQFAVGEVRTGETASRAETHTIAYNPSTHPDKLGVVACYEGENQQLVTQKVTTKDYVAVDAGGGKWSSDLFWPTVSDKPSIDFVGYMANEPLPEATVTKTATGYKFELAVSLAHPVLVQNVDESDAAKSKSVDKAPLVCCKPIHTTGFISPVTFEMDRVLTGYSVWFQLGDRMDNLRDFIVKEVSVYGKAPAGAKATVEYGATTHSKTITWSNYDTATSFGTAASPLKLVWKENSQDKTLVVSNSLEKWGDATPSSGAFFAIPSLSFNPTIRVKYDVVLNDANGVVTRQGVVSTIVLNTTNFPSLAQGKPGEINPIKIKIVPSYLYVLADKDQASGYIVLQ